HADGVEYHVHHMGIFDTKMSNSDDSTKTPVENSDDTSVAAAIELNDPFEDPALVTNVIDMRNDDGFSALEIALRSGSEACAMLITRFAKEYQKTRRCQFGRASFEDGEIGFCCDLRNLGSAPNCRVGKLLFHIHKKELKCEKMSINRAYLVYAMVRWEMRIAKLGRTSKAVDGQLGEVPRLRRMSFTRRGSNEASETDIMIEFDDAPPAAVPFASRRPFILNPPPRRLSRDKLSNHLKQVPPSEYAQDMNRSGRPPPPSKWVQRTISSDSQSSLPSPSSSVTTPIETKSLSVGDKLRSIFSGRR
ncbi:hypothetical protein TELCIR_07879, partial [Teladorsagia circumcincta]